MSRADRLIAIGTALSAPVVVWGAAKLAQGAVALILLGLG